MVYIAKQFPQNLRSFGQSKKIKGKIWRVIEILQTKLLEKKCLK